MKNNLAWSFCHALTNLCICSQQQNLPDSELLPQNLYQNELLGKGFNGKFIESSKAPQMHSKHAQQTWFNESKLRKLICIKLTFISFQELLKSTELLLWVRGKSFSFLWLCTDGRSATQILAVQKYSLSDRLRQLISSSSLAVGFWEVQSIKSKTLQLTDCVLHEYFQKCRSFVT